MVSKNLDATSFFIIILKEKEYINHPPQLQNPKNMSAILLIILIIISLTVTFRNRLFQSRIKNSLPLEHLFTIDFSDFKQFNLSESDKSLCIIKISRNTFIQKPPFPQR